MCKLLHNAGGVGGKYAHVHQIEGLKICSPYWAYMEYKPTEINVQKGDYCDGTSKHNVLGEQYNNYIVFTSYTYKENQNMIYT